MEEAKDILVLQASYTNPVHAEAICHVLNGYAEDPMGGGHSLPAEVLARPCLQRIGVRQWRTGGVGQLLRGFFHLCLPAFGERP
jgi:hypothetical protein